jgi:predicted ATPase
MAHGFRSLGPEIAGHYERAVTLGRGLGDDKKLFRAMWGSWYANLMIGQTEHALGIANELVEVARRLGDPDLMLEAYHSRWANSHVIGLNSSVLGDTKLGIAIYDAERHHAHTYDYGGHDTGVCAYAHGAVTLWISGFADQAAQMVDDALELGHRLGHPPSLAHAAAYSATLQQLLRAPGPCRELSELTMRIGREQGSNMFYMCPLLLGWTIFVSGDAAEGLQQMGNAVARTRQSARRFYFEYELLVFAEALLKAGELDRAQNVLQETLDRITSSGNCLFEAELHRLSGICQRKRGGDGIAEAEALLLKALERSEEQGALSFKLRAATDLARLWRDHNRHGDAHDVLSQVYQRFTEGFDTPDLKDARTLLDELGASGGPRA